MTGEDGIHTDRVKGVHDGDYFIEIKAQNRAKLESVHTLQVCINVRFTIKKIRIMSNIFFESNHKSKKRGNDQESIPSSTFPKT